MALLGLIGLMLPIGLTIFVNSVPGHYLVPIPPSLDAGRIVGDAGGLVVGLTAWPNLVVATGVDTGSLPASLRMHGAWLVLPAPAAGCFVQGGL